MGDSVPHSADGCPRDLLMRRCELRKAFLDLCGSFPEKDKVHGDSALRLCVRLKVCVTHPVHEFDGILFDKILGSGPELTEIFAEATVHQTGSA